MKQFEYVRPLEAAAAIRAIAKDDAGYFLAGGTNLVDLMKMNVTDANRLVDINRLPLKDIQKKPGVLSIGALAANSVVAESSVVQKHSPLLALAINAGASPQLRNMATTGGNLMQRTRCGYFFDITMPCNKRNPGSGCSALEGYNRMHAIFGASDKCIAVNPSDMNVALAALDATVHVSSAGGNRSIKIADFHRLPGEHPEADTTLQKGELITGVDIPDAPFTKNIAYLKIRDRTSYAFALVSAAVALQTEGGIIKDARIAMGGVAHKPWRMHAAESFLRGKRATENNFSKAAALSFTDAKAYEYNRFKLKLAPNTMIQSLKTASGISSK